jgi:hypothetical protein
MVKKRKCREKLVKTPTPISTGNSKKDKCKKKKIFPKTDVRQDVRQIFVLPTGTAKKSRNLRAKDKKKISSKNYGDLPELTDVEREVFLLYFKENITNTDELAKKRKVTRRTIQATINRIKNKGLWMKNEHMFVKGGGTRLPLVRDNTSERHFLHGQIFKIEILDYTDFFQKTMAIKKTIIDDLKLPKTKIPNKVLITKKYVEIHSKNEFVGEDYDSCLEKSLDYWSRFINYLEQKYKIILLKVGYSNVQYSHLGHFGDTENDIAEDFKRRKKRLQVRGKDGKVWLHTDNSEKDKPHFEFVHPETSKKDADLLKETFDDIENNFGGSLQDTLNDIKENYSITNPFKPSQQPTKDEFNKLIQSLNILGENLNSFMSHQKKINTSCEIWQNSTQEYLYELGESHRQLLLTVSTFSKFMLKFEDSFSKNNSDSKSSDKKILDPRQKDINMFM